MAVGLLGKFVSYNPATGVWSYGATTGSAEYFQSDGEADPFDWHGPTYEIRLEGRAGALRHTMDLEEVIYFIRGYAQEKDETVDQEFVDSEFYPTEIDLATCKNPTSLMHDRYMAYKVSRIDLRPEKARSEPAPEKEEATEWDKVII